MQLQKKALYNLLQFNYLEDSSMQVEPWQVEDLRSVGTDTLFKRLHKLGLKIEKDSFFLYAEDCESPEELTDCFLEKKENIAKSDQIFLIIFELWRRFFPERQCVSIFCDELDHQIYLYDKDLLENDEKIQASLANLEEILDENVEMGISPTQAFCILSEYCAHDSEKFLYDYISEQIDANNDIYASELLEGFYPYIEKTIWFDLLKARIIARTNIAKSNEIIRKILHDLQQEPNLEFQFALLRFMVQAGDRSLFIKLVKKTVSQIQKEADFKMLISMVADYFRRLDLEEIESKVNNIMKKREKKAHHDKLDQDDIDIKELDLLLT